MRGSLVTLNIEKIIETDVLVIGGGAAGARAAIEAHRNNVRVFLAAKGIFGAGGCSLSPSLASAIGPWSAQDDSVEKHFHDMVVQGKQYLCDQKLAKQQAEASGEALAELEQWGLVWDRNTENKIALFPSSKLFPGVSGQDRWITFGRRGTNAVGPFWTGHGVVDILRDELNRSRIPYMQEVVISKIIIRDDEVCGALGYDYLNAQPVLFKCKAAVLATGDASQVYYPHCMVSRESTGDGFALAYEAGATLVNMEQFEYLALMNAYPDSARGKAVLESPLESGEMAYLKNAKGERFMQRYHKDGELAPQEELTKAIYTEVKAGRGGPHGGCFVDLRHIPRRIVERSAPIRLEHIERLGYDISKDLIEVYPVIHTTTGGVRINERCETGVTGLYAAGQLAFAVNDCLAEGATGIVDAVLRGKISGANAARYAKSKPQIDPAEQQVNSALDQIMAPLNNHHGPTPLSVIRKLQHVMWNYVGVVKDEAGLTKSVEEISEIRDFLTPKVAARIKTGRFNVEMLESIELKHMIVCAEAIARSSLTRKESRNRFHRSDYPHQNDREWLNHILIRKSTQGMALTLEPVEFPYLKPEVK